MTNFYLYDQNNSGGSFEVDDDVAHRVIIEAVSAAKANKKAKSVGIYFNGVEKGIDCECCGDRWSSASESNATPHPSQIAPEVWPLSRPVVAQYKPITDWRKHRDWANEVWRNLLVRVYRIDGSVEHYEMSVTDL